MARKATEAGLGPPSYQDDQTKPLVIPIDIKGGNRTRFVAKVHEYGTEDEGKPILLSSPNAAQGPRGTRVYLVKSENILDETFSLVLKDYWRLPRPGTCTEGEVYEALNAIDYQALETIHSSLYGLKIARLPKSIAWGDVAESMNGETRGAPPASSVSGSVNLDGPKRQTVAGTEDQGIHTRVVTDLVGRHLCEFASLPHLLRVLLDALHRKRLPFLIGAGE